MDNMNNSTVLGESIAYFRHRRQWYLLPIFVLLFLVSLAMPFGFALPFDDTFEDGNLTNDGWCDGCGGWDLNNNSEMIDTWSIESIASNARTFNDIETGGVDNVSLVAYAKNAGGGTDLILIGFSDQSAGIPSQAPGSQDTWIELHANGSAFGYTAGESPELFASFNIGEIVRAEIDINKANDSAYLRLYNESGVLLGDQFFSPTESSLNNSRVYLFHIGATSLDFIDNVSVTETPNPPPPPPNVPPTITVPSPNPDPPTDSQAVAWSVTYVDEEGVAGNVTFTHSVNATPVFVEQVNNTANNTLATSTLPASFYGGGANVSVSVQATDGENTSTTRVNSVIAANTPTPTQDAEVLGVLTIVISMMVVGFIMFIWISFIAERTPEVALKARRLMMAAIGLVIIVAVVTLLT